MKEAEISKSAGSKTHKFPLLKLLRDMWRDLENPKPILLSRRAAGDSFLIRKEAPRSLQISKWPLVLENKEANISISIDRISETLVVQSEGLEMGSES